MNKLIILTALLILFFNSCLETCEDATKRIDLLTAFHGGIDSLFLDSKRKNQQCVTVSGRTFLIYNDLYKKFSIGDTLFKREGSMKYHWIKNGDTTIFFQMCGPLKSDEVRDDN